MSENSELKSLKFKKSLGSELKSLQFKQKLGSGMSKLGSAAGSAGGMSLVFSLIFMAFVFFANFHMIYLKTGTPMFKYGLGMTFLQPFYSMYSVYIVFAKYALKQSVRAGGSALYTSSMMYR